MYPSDENDTSRCIQNNILLFQNIKGSSADK